MPVHVACPGCGGLCPVAEEHLGKSLRCTACGRVFRGERPAPGPEPVPEALRTEPGGPPPRRRDDDRPPPRRPRYDDDYRRPPPRSSSSSAWIWILVAVCVLPFFACAGLIVVGALGGFVSYFAVSSSGSVSSAPVATAIDPAEVDQAAPGFPGGPGVPGGPQGPPPAVRPDPVVIPPPPPAAIRAPNLAQEKVVRMLPAPVTDVTAGGGGRYLILNLPSKKQLAVFDANTAEVVKYLPAGGDDVLIAAGMDKLVVLRKGGSKVERWSLTTFEREAEAELSLDVPAAAAAMGEASNGPLVVSAVNWPVLGETAFFDVLKMQRIDMDAAFDRHGFFETSPDVFLRASADGRVFACQQSLGGTVQTCVWTLGDVQKYAGGNGVSRPVPGPDGAAIYTNRGVFDVQMKQLHPFSEAAFVPAHGGPFYLSLSSDAPGAPEGRKAEVSLYLSDYTQPFTTLADVEGAEPAKGFNPDRLTPDKRLHLIPAAKLFVSIPRSNDRLVVRRFDPVEALQKTGWDYLDVVSLPPTLARKGEEYAYQLDVLSKKGGLTYGVQSGPPGMTIDAAGRLTWKVPADFADRTAAVLVSVRDSGGEQVLHSFTVGVASGGG
jgi:putative Ig domain-containing protein